MNFFYYFMLFQVLRENEQQAKTFAIKLIEHQENWLSVISKIWGVSCKTTLVSVCSCLSSHIGLSIRDICPFLYNVALSST